jgi:uncharacterized protein (TIGR02391 family)
MDREWAIEELANYMALVEQYSLDRTDFKIRRELLARQDILEQIADRTLPQWRDDTSYNPGTSFNPDQARIFYFRDLAIRCKMRLERAEELEKYLGDLGPSLNASALHPWVWDAAKSLWGSNHYGEAVNVASRSVNARLQTKVGRLDVSEGDLVAQAFSTSPPVEWKPRLRLMDDDGSETFKSLQGGAVAFGQGCFRAMRNVLSHEADATEELPQQEALEYLAAFSVLARWIDRAEVVSA